MWVLRAACKYGAMALNLTAASPQDKSQTRRDFAVAHFGYDDIPPVKCVLGQLVFYSSKIGDKFAPNAAPGLFAVQVGDLSRVVPIKALVWSLILQSSRAGLVLGLTRYQFLSKRFMLRMMFRAFL